MKRRIVWVLVAVTLVLVAAALVAAWALQPDALDVPHGVGGDRADCVRCHTAKNLPSNHGTYASERCRSCHSE
jgi:hypothetical protein